MRIESVKLENFKPYAGELDTVYFSREEKQNVTMIHGVNGAGKSKFFEAINWCLYGSVALDEDKKTKDDDPSEVTHKASIKACRPGGTLTTRVTISFSHKAKKYQVKRTIQCRKQSENAHTYENEEFLMMRNSGDGKFKNVDNPVGELNNILPENVRTYFLFDGEKIDNFAKPGSSQDVENAIKQILKLEVLTRSQKHLYDIAEEYRQELKTIASQELKDLLDRQKSKEDEKKKHTERQSELSAEIESAEKKITEIDQRLKGMKEAQKLQEDRQRIEKEMSAKNSELEKTAERVREIASTGFGIIGKGILEKASAVIEEKRVKGVIPQNIRDQFLQDILDSRMCICGRAFADHGPESEHLVALKVRSISSDLESDVLRLSANLKGIVEVSGARQEELRKEVGRRIALIDDIERLDAEIGEISRKLKGSRQEDVAATEKRRQEFKEDINRDYMEIGSSRDKVSEIERELKQIKEEIDQTKKDKKKERQLTAQMKLAQEAAEAIDTIYQVFADEMRQRIEAKMQEIFNKLIWKESQYTKVRLTPDYKLEVVDRWGFDAGHDLSAGERQILSLSFIAAMAEETREEAPIIMDTPFGRLSRQHRENITETIPQLANQLVLFVTDEEMTGKMEQNLAGFTGERYHLNFNENRGCTTIEKM